MTLNDFQKENVLYGKKAMNTFKSVNAIAESRIGDNLVKIKEERDFCKVFKLFQEVDHSWA